MANDILADEPFAHQSLQKTSMGPSREIPWISVESLSHSENAQHKYTFVCLFVADDLRLRKHLLLTEGVNSLCRMTLPNAIQKTVKGMKEFERRMFDSQGGPEADWVAQLS